MRTRYRQRPPKPSAPDCLFFGPCRAINDHAAKEIRIETAEDHPQGFRIPICRLPQGRMADARAIVALSELIRAARPFAALGRQTASHDPDAPLLTAAELEITAGDAQAIAAALERALGPAEHFRNAGRGLAPKPENRP